MNTARANSCSMTPTGTIAQPSLESRRGGIAAQIKEEHTNARSQKKALQRRDGASNFTRHARCEFAAEFHRVIR